MIRIERMFPDHPEFAQFRRYAYALVSCSLIAGIVAIGLGIVKAVS